MQNLDFVCSSGTSVPIKIRSTHGRNIVLRVRLVPSPEIHVSKPIGTSETMVACFINSKRKWLEQTLAKSVEKTRLCSSDWIEIFGKKTQVLHDSGRRGNELVEQPDGSMLLFIGGDVRMLESRVRFVIKQELLKKIKEIIRETPSDLWPAKIALRDTSSRWGSCSSSGTISFSWRLAFAPISVLRYVVMHELAHRRYMNHSEEFWNFVRVLYGDGVGSAKYWLSRHGTELHSCL